MVKHAYTHVHPEAHGYVHAHTHAQTHTVYSQRLTVTFTRVVVSVVISRARSRLVYISLTDLRRPGRGGWHQEHSQHGGRETASRTSKKKNTKKTGPLHSLTTTPSLTFPKELSTGPGLALESVGEESGVRRRGKPFGRRRMSETIKYMCKNINLGLEMG